MPFSLTYSYFEAGASKVLTSDYVFILRTSAIQTSLIALGLASVRKNQIVICFFARLFVPLQL